MNDDVRAAVNARLRDRGLSRADLARAIGKTPQEITRALNGSKNGGVLPPLWIAILEALDLELTAQPRGKNSDEK